MATLFNTVQERDTDPSQGQVDMAHAEMLKIVHNLGSNRPWEAHAAARAIKEMGPASIAALMQMVQVEGRRGKWRRRRFLTISIVSTVLLLVEIARTASFNSMEFFGAWIFGTSVLSLFIAQSISIHEALNRLQNNATLALTYFEDLCIAGPLIEAFDSGDHYLQQIIGKALQRLLPRFRATDSHLLDLTQRASLYSLLESCTRPRLSLFRADLGVAILRALEQIGDKKALPYVERLAAGNESTEAHRRVVAAAWACLPYLQARVEQQQLSQSLLRPVIAEEPEPATLLRTLEHALAEDPHTLLRPLS